VTQMISIKWFVFTQKPRIFAPLPRIQVVLVSVEKTQHGLPAELGCVARFLQGRQRMRLVACAMLGPALRDKHAERGPTSADRISGSSGECVSTDRLIPVPRSRQTQQSSGYSNPTHAARDPRSVCPRTRVDRLFLSSMRMPYQRRCAFISGPLVGRSGLAPTNSHRCSPVKRRVCG
jgi:hypothetical protein